jgi:prepilin-type N-terminal cleavage/methylation domain-containing protein
MHATRTGVTLPELLIALILIAVLLSLALPSLRNGLDGLAVRAARETAFALFSRARVIALETGGAQVELDATHDVITLRAASGAVQHEQHFSGADLILEGNDASVVLRYDAHGLGRMMSRTLSFRVRSAAAGLTVSSFGRVRRW